MATADVRNELFALFAEVVATATEHGKSGDGASAHVRYMPHRRGFAFDPVVTDRGPGIRATLGNNQTLTQFASDTDAIKAAVQMSVSGTGAPDRGLGLWRVHTAMLKPSRALWIHSEATLLRIRGDGETHVSETVLLDGTMVRMVIPE